MGYQDVAPDISQKLQKNARNMRPGTCNIRGNTVDEDGRGRNGALGIDQLVEGISQIDSTSCHLDCCEGKKSVTSFEVEAGRLCIEDDKDGI